MSENKFTPGPWKVDEEIEGEERFVSSENELAIIAIIEPYKDFARQQEREANAHLISAAPDLLEACKIALYGGGTIVEATEKIRAAIAKAEGRHA